MGIDIDDVVLLALDFKGNMIQLIFYHLFVFKQI